MTPKEIFIVVMIVLAVVCAIVGIGVLALTITKYFYRRWIVENSVALKKLREINAKYVFKHVEQRTLTQEYDAEHNYNNVSPKDYLIYQLVYLQHQLKNDLASAKENDETYKKYREEIAAECNVGDYVKVKWNVFKKYAQKIERNLLNEVALKPETRVTIIVELYHVNINHILISRKDETFYEDEIIRLIKRLRNKIGNFYQDREIWDAICRVERARVSNRMRFSIYERDGHRCRKCGISGRHHDLEIDHIIPISKGGKSTYDNLQTLCRRCNLEKGSKIE
jgi:hypothetical protein